MDPALSSDGFRKLLENFTELFAHDSTYSVQ